ARASHPAGPVRAVRGQGRQVEGEGTGPRQPPAELSALPSPVGEQGRRGDRPDPEARRAAPGAVLVPQEGEPDGEGGRRLRPTGLLRDARRGGARQLARPAAFRLPRADARAGAERGAGAGEGGERGEDLPAARGRPLGAGDADGGAGEPEAATVSHPKG